MDPSTAAPAVLSVLLLVAGPRVCPAASIAWELDPYYSNVSLTAGLTETTIPEVADEDETALYRRLFSSSWIPKFVMVEASVNPLPWAGVLIRRNFPAFYADAEAAKGVNLIQAVTEGFEEPYAFSFFLGSVVRYVRPGEEEKAKNRGFMGYVVSVGDRHIQDNVLIDDHWTELEWKVKGDQDFSDRTRNWSFRVGGKWHEHEAIADAVYLSLRRESLSTRAGDSWVDNADVEYTVQFGQASGAVIQQELFVTRKWPLPFGPKTAAGFGIGVIVEKGKYSGTLARPDETEVRLMLRPSIKF